MNTWIEKPEKRETWGNKLDQYTNSCDEGEIQYAFRLLFTICFSIAITAKDSIRSFFILVLRLLPGVLHFFFVSHFVFFTMSFRHWYATSRSLVATWILVRTHIFLVSALTWQSLCLSLCPSLCLFVVGGRLYRYHDIFALDSNASSGIPLPPLEEGWWILAISKLFSS